MGELFEDYPKPDRPVDFVLMHKDKPIAVGLARYDSDRGEPKKTTGQVSIVIAPTKLFSIQRQQVKISR